MFSRSFINVSRQSISRPGLRFQSTQAKAVARFNSAKDTTVYWSKVIAELGKQVYLKEGFAPPSTTQIQQVYESLYKQALGLVKTSPSQLTKNLQTSITGINKAFVYKYGSYGVQLLGLFSLGEIIGRRQIVGYPSFGPKAEHH